MSTRKPTITIIPTEDEKAKYSDLLAPMTWDKLFNKQRKYDEDEKWAKETYKYCPCCGSKEISIDVVRGGKAFKMWCVKCSHSVVIDYRERI
jgi:formate dehydrogenase maturation protein FdhE